MQDTITTMFCLCDDFLKANDYHDDVQCRVSSAEIMTVPLVACAFFGGNFALARCFLVSPGYFQRNLSASRFCRRLHSLPKELWRSLFRVLGEVFIRHNKSQKYVVDSFPVPACDNIRISRCKLFQQVVPGRRAPRLYSQQTSLLLWLARALRGHRTRATH